MEDLVLAKLFLQFVLSSVFGVGMDEGYATLYGTPDDPWAQGLMACTHRRVPQNQRVCAHRWLPCPGSVGGESTTASTSTVTAPRPATAKTARERGFMSSQSHGTDRGR